jgi:hypothetical protein
MSIVFYDGAIAEFNAAPLGEKEPETKKEKICILLNLLN